MDVLNAATWTPPPHWRTITVIDSHTGGEPFRVVIDGIPHLEGDTILERRRYAMEHLDYLRRILIWEPRGHADMYGAFLSPPVSHNSEIGVLFIHNQGFSTMCGHGIIALTKVMLDTGILPPRKGKRPLRIDTPAGQITAVATVRDGLVDEVTFRNVASYAVALGQSVEISGLGRVVYDIAYGGAFYAYVDAAALSLDLDDTTALIRAGRIIKSALSESDSVDHPDASDLGFLYGVIFTGPARVSGNHSRNVCVFADGEIDRSPTGTGVSGRLAILRARGEIELEKVVVIESIVGSTFSGRAVEDVTVGPHKAVIPEITGTAHITGRSQFWVDPSDHLGEGFLIR